MKEITRIHIARISYDIELDAKKQLELYLKNLESYGGDSEIIDDIEIRMTEILAERGVTKGGVIGSKDVAVLKDQLGEASEIMGEVNPVSTVESSRTTRTLFRDTDNAAVGGVLSGIAAFFGINPVWIRLLFIVSLFASAGATFLVYIVLWMVVPAARTAADKLQMRGEPVTAASIKKLNDSEAGVPTRMGGISGRKIVTVSIGIAASLAAALSVLVTIAAIAAVTIHGGDNSLVMGGETNFLVAAFILGVVSGLLLTVLCIVIAYAAFSQKFTRRIGIVIGVIVLMGTTTFGTGLGLAQYARLRHEAVVQANTHEEAIMLPADAAITKLDLQVSSKARVVYSVTNGPMKATLRTVNEGSADSAKVDTVIKDGLLTIKYDPKSDTCISFLCRDTMPLIVIEGPSLASLHVAEGATAEYEATTQPNLSVELGKDATVRTAGSIAALDATLEEAARLATDRSAIQKFTARLTATAEINAGTVEQFSLDHPNACGQGDHSVITVERISSNQMTINGVAQKAETTNLACVNILLHNERHN